MGSGWRTLAHLQHPPSALPAPGYSPPCTQRKTPVSQPPLRRWHSHVTWAPPISLRGETQDAGRARRGAGLCGAHCQVRVPGVAGLGSAVPDKRGVRVRAVAPARLGTLQPRLAGRRLDQWGPWAPLPCAAPGALWPPQRFWKGPGIPLFTPR